MQEVIFVLLGVIVALSVIVMLYPFIMYIKLKKQEKRVKELYLQIRAQIDIKYNLIVEMENKNKDIIKLLEEYTKEVDEKYNLDLKMYNDKFNDFISVSKNNEVIEKCNLAEEKINYVKEYYNEIVCAYNRFKSNKLIAYLSKSFSINDAKLY